MGRGGPRRHGHLDLKFLFLTLIMGQEGGRNVLFQVKGKLSEKKAFSAPPPRGGGAHFAQAIRAISTARLHASLHLHLRPIDVVVSHGPLKRSHLAAGFALICLQRLSRPDVATRRCPWRDNRCTSGRSGPVLSY